MEELYKRYGKLFDEGSNILDEGYTLVDVMYNEIGSLGLEYGVEYINDWRNIAVYIEKLKTLRQEMIFFVILQEIIYKIEGEKDRFLVQKTLKDLLPNFDGNISCEIKNARVVKFSDYRTIDWAKRLIELLLQMKQLYHDF